MASIALLVAALAFAPPLACLAGHARVGVRGASSDRTVSTQEVEGNLRDSLRDVLQGSSEAAERNLAHIEAAMWETFQALPKNAIGRLEPRAVRHLVHGYFAKEHGWVISGLEATHHGAPANGSEGREASVLQDRAPAFVEALLGARRAGRGLSLGDVVAMGAALQKLIVEESFSLLRTAYSLNGESIVNSVDAATVHEVLSSYLLIMEMGVLGDEKDVRRHRAIKKAVAQVEPTSWSAVRQFERDAVHNFDFESHHRTNPFAPRRYSFGQASQMVERLARGYGRWQNAECLAMKEELAKMDGDGSGRVPLKSFYSKPDTADYQFKETVDYLRKIGAYDEATNSVRIVNYLAGPSNCIAKSAYYSVCCQSECEGLMNELETKVKAPSTTPEHLLGVISNLTSVEVDDMRLPEDAAMARLRDIASHNDGEVPLHGRLFAEFLHYAFPLDCPYPHVAEDAAVFSPASWTSSQVAATEEEKLAHLSAEEPELRLPERELAWSVEEVLPLVEPAKHARSTWSVLMHPVVQCAAFVAMLRAVVAGLRAASAACFGGGKGEGSLLPTRV